ncbi:hypothetical protein C4K03_3763 [Pseudomonas synxantha]|uniref:Uncharacterized protein n=1 Tax=Pseudomonas synxantha TaxID=47883 RepID=A0A3G7UBB7_9PSED|nr:hypothetical protein [Pseudomonas synxantha]AZE55916.1 hypothetical protein C4K03_3763 [Pseudomonas synxantha]
MKLHKYLESFVYCTFLVLLASILIGLTGAVFEAIFAGLMP